MRANPPGPGLNPTEPDFPSASPAPAPRTAAPIPESDNDG